MNISVEIIGYLCKNRYSQPILAFLISFAECFIGNFRNRSIAQNFKAAKKF